MTVQLRVRDRQNRIYIDDQMLVGRFLTQIVFAWNEFTTKTVTHQGLTQGTFFYQVVNRNVHNVNTYSVVIGNASWVDVSVSGSIVTATHVLHPDYRGLNQSKLEAMVFGRHPVIVQIGIY